ncbi:MAG TPA: hypothetical protein VFX92_14300 [Candidatus Krumholzibacteria bacterium]|nr:hypothetical protein [Candidatus Krumholzibacteria bacterium]
MRLPTAGMLLLLPLLAIGCDDSPTRPATSPAPLAWTQLDGGIGEPRFVAGWGAGPDSVLALGTSFPMLRMTGGVWAPEPLAPGFAALRSIWGRATDDVFAVGENGLIIHFDGTGWAAQPAGTPGRCNDVWGIASPGAYAVATDPASGAGRVLQYNGTAWSTMTGRFDYGLNAVWAFDARSVFVAGVDGYVARYDNRGWTALVPFATGYAWLDAWGAAAADVFFVGEGGRAGHYQNGTLVVANTPVTETLRAVFGFAADDVWAVGDGGVMVHFDGNAWTAAPPVTTGALRTAFAFDDGTAMALGDNGTVLRLEGGVWNAVHRGRTITWNDVYCAGPGAAIFVGRRGTADGIIRHVDGREWSFPGTEVVGVFGYDIDDVYAVGRGGSIRHFDGTNWTQETSGTLTALFAVTGVTADTSRRLYAVGDRRTIRVWDGAHWGPMVPPGGSISPIYDVWAAAADDVFAVDADGLVLRYRGPLSSLQWSEEDPGLDGSRFNAIAGRGPTDVVAVSEDGRIFQFNGRTWRSMPMPAAGVLPDVALDGARDGFALSRPHTMLTLHNARWTSSTIPYLGELLTLGVAGDTGFAAGTGGSILEFHR